MLATLDEVKEGLGDGSEGQCYCTRTRNRVQCSAPSNKAGRASHVCALSTTEAEKTKDCLGFLASSPAEKCLFRKDKVESGRPGESVSSSHWHALIHMCIATYMHITLTQEEKLNKVKGSTSYLEDRSNPWLGQPATLTDLRQCHADFPTCLFKLHIHQKLVFLPHS